MLIIRLSSIGDIVLTTPVLRCLKTQAPSAEVHYLVKKKYAPVLADNPYIDKLHLFENNLKAMIAILKKEDFDFIADLHHNQRTFFIKTALQKPSYAFNKLTFEKWLMVMTKWDRMPDVHIVDRYMETLTSLGIQNDGQGLDFFIAPQNEVIISKHFPSIGKRPYIAIAIGAQHFTKRLPNHKLRNICELIDQPIILLGGKGDAENGALIAQKTGEQVVNTCGKFNIQQSASIVRQAQKVITHDTGLMHIAAAFDKPILSIWGSTIPAFGMTPYFKKNEDNGATIMEVNNLSCRPCSKIGKKKCPKKHFYCMELLDENEVADWVGNL